MRPGRREPSVVIDQYSEVDTFATAIHYMRLRLPVEFGHQINEILPDFIGIMSAHTSVLRMVRERGLKEPNQASIALNEDQITFLGLILFATAKGHQDRLVRYECKSALQELGDNFAMSKKLLGRSDLESHK